MSIAELCLKKINSNNTKNRFVYISAVKTLKNQKRRHENTYHNNNFEGNESHRNWARHVKVKICSRDQVENDYFIKFMGHGEILDTFYYFLFKDLGLEFLYSVLLLLIEILRKVFSSMLSRSPEQNFFGIFLRQEQYDCHNLLFYAYFLLFGPCRRIAVTRIINIE